MLQSLWNADSASGSTQGLSVIRKRLTYSVFCVPNIQEMRKENRLQKTMLGQEKFLALEKKTNLILMEDKKNLSITTLSLNCMLLRENNFKVVNHCQNVM